MSYSLFSVFQPAVPSVYIIHHVQHFTDSSPDSVGLAHEFFVVSNVLVQIIQEFLGDFNAYFWHQGHSPVIIFTLMVSLSCWCLKLWRPVSIEIRVMGENYLIVIVAKISMNAHVNCA